MHAPTRTTGFAAAVGAAATLLAPVALATPAEAATTKDGCIVTSGRPFHAGLDRNGAAVIRRSLTLTCDPGRSVAFESRLVEQDLAGRPGDGNPNEDLIVTTKRTVSSFLTATVRTTQTVTLGRVVPRPVPDETDTIAELYQTVRFRVTSNGVQGSASALEFSGVRNVQL
jgi:hypothetical protein